MSTQPEALRLAGALTAATEQTDAEDDVIHVARWFVEDAAAELRRLHAENESLRQIVQDFPPVEAELREVSDRAHRLETQRDLLLEALKNVMYWDNGKSEWEDARAAIKAVEEWK